MGAGLFARNALGAEGVEFTSDRTQPQGNPAYYPGAATTFGTIKQIDAGVLNVGYAEDGPMDGPAVILLHGWPYDIHSYIDVAPLLAAKGYRVIVPYLRGYGSTRFLSDSTSRNGQQSALAQDSLYLMDALKIPKAILAGFDWAREQRILSRLYGQSDAQHSSQ